MVGIPKIFMKFCRSEIKNLTITLKNNFWIALFVPLKGKKKDFEKRVKFKKIIAKKLRGDMHFWEDLR